MTLMDTRLEKAGIISVMQRSRGKSESRKMGVFKANLEGLLWKMIELSKLKRRRKGREVKKDITEDLIQFLYFLEFIEF